MYPNRILPLAEEKDFFMEYLGVVVPESTKTASAIPPFGEKCEGEHIRRGKR